MKVVFVKMRFYFIFAKSDFIIECLLQFAWANLGKYKFEIEHYKSDAKKHNSEYQICREDEYTNQ